MAIREVSEDELVDKEDEFAYLQEEIIEQDGTYEELLAYDNQEEEYLFEHNKRLNISKRRRHGLPPITPKASTRDLVRNLIFDHLWCELINWSSNTIEAYFKNVLNNGKRPFYFVLIHELFIPYFFCDLKNIRQMRIERQPPLFRAKTTTNPDIKWPTWSRPIKSSVQSTINN
jgi:hypothetical protein